MEGFALFHRCFTGLILNAADGKAIGPKFRRVCDGKIVTEDHIPGSRAHGRARAVRTGPIVAFGTTVVEATKTVVAATSGGQFQR